jgi:O-acetyl-ADP-ribose deacetylase (regulator of RNase III)
MRRRVETLCGDITTQSVDAIVNAANRSLLGGGGVDGAIHRAAWPGPARRVPGGASGGIPHRPSDRRGGGDHRRNLSARWVIHTVGPNWHRGQRDPQLLRRCFTRSLDVADEVGARSVAFPAVSAGVYGWDPAVVARIAVEAAHDETSGDGVELVRFVLFDDTISDTFERTLAAWRGDPAG